ncbi:MAG: HD domain-containing protein [Gammaproteobacteria bacterium]|nr:HD domain-containing protein [Gammaproteobacteria bacterium]MDH3465962.1 HD domain-containing protein [Gammaproteobacteria bacterium]
MNSTGGLGLIIRALAFAADKHRDQRRKNKDASPYINHPVALADVLVNAAGITDSDVICSALLHDTIEDTDTTAAELEAAFGTVIQGIVLEVTDDTSLPKLQRKQRQIDRARHVSSNAKLVKLADKICNLRDMATAPPADWPLDRRQEYFDWAKTVVDRLRGVHPLLETLFDEAYRARPE